ncbi:RcnB family protein [Sphingobium sp. AS12]|uniref:RcnB family protein n=1 Tax=Sphingobium sp. AS12 TaxID=2849495 RepID=UPI001C3164E7|nr:RcnB family protein [Sphingobium sp. AS12]MBV2147856.1 RcnB family protein [Sphingobium sp. AS12]
MFKKILMALATTTLVASPIISSQAQAQGYGPPHRQEQTRTVVKQKENGRTVVKQKTVVRKHVRANRYAASNHRWAKGQRFDRRQATNYRVINNYRGYRLNAPPRGYQWVQSGNDAVLIAITSGLIGAVIGGVIR